LRAKPSASARACARIIGVKFHFYAQKHAHHWGLRAKHAHHWGVKLHFLD